MILNPRRLAPPDESLLIATATQPSLPWKPTHDEADTGLDPGRRVRGDHGGVAPGTFATPRSTRGNHPDRQGELLHVHPALARGTLGLDRAQAHRLSLAGPVETNRGPPGRGEDDRSRPQGRGRGTLQRVWP